jgi:hypothetical protein
MTCLTGKLEEIKKKKIKKKIQKNMKKYRAFFRNKFWQNFHPKNNLNNKN